MNAIKLWIKSNPVWTAIGVAFLLFLAVLIVSNVRGYFDHRADVNNNAHETIGQQREQTKANEETINAVQNAHDAVNNPQPDDLERMRSRFDRARDTNGS